MIDFLSGSIGCLIKIYAEADFSYYFGLRQEKSSQTYVWKSFKVLVLVLHQSFKLF